MLILQYQYENFSLKICENSLTGMLPVSNKWK